MSEQAFAWHCPGCRESHWIPLGPPRGWQLARDGEGRPTVTPSVLCTWRGVDDDGSPVEQVCHVFIRHGMIEYLSDCTHDHAGRTVPCEERRREVVGS